MKTEKLLATLAVVSIVIFAGCKKDDFVGKVGVCPVVISTIPANSATGVPVNQVITVTFNEKMNPATITQTSFTLQGPSKVTGTLTYDGSGPTFSFTPTTPLLYNTTYTGKVATSVKDNTGNALQKEYVWSFTTIGQYTVTLSSNPLAGGTTTGGGTYDSGSSVTIGATANSGYTFSNWTEGGTMVSTNANYTFTLTGNRTLVANFTENIKVYSVTVASNPQIGGTTTGGGSYNAGTSVTVGATANSGYTFTNWTEGGTVVSTNASYTFTIGGNRTLIANFSENIKVYNVTLSSNPIAGGTTTGGGSFNEGTSVTVVATANTDYTFTNWTEGAIVVSANPTYTFTLNGNRALVANFTKIIKVYTVTVSANPAAGGTATGGGSFNEGTSVTVAATANTGYTFANWTEGTTVVSTSPGYTFTASGNRNLVANFTLNVYSIGVSAKPTAGGTATGGGSYNYSSSATVVATANTGYTFTNWTEGTTVVSTNASYTFTINANRTLVANFTINVYSVALSTTPPTWGTATGAGPYNYGSSVTVAAVANPGYYFSAWTDGYDVVSTDASYTFTITENRSLVANFRESIVVNSLTVSANPLIGGTVSGGGSFNSGTLVTVRAFANFSYNFTNWSENGTVISTDATYTFTLNSNRNLVANFTKSTLINCILLSSNPLNGGTTSGGGTYYPGETITIKATPNTDFTFVSWSEDGNWISDNANYTFVMTKTRNLVANFVKGPVSPAARNPKTRNQ